MSRNLTDTLNSYFDDTEVRSIEIGLAEKLARSRHADFDEVIAAVFQAMAMEGRYVDPSPSVVHE